MANKVDHSTTILPTEETAEGNNPLKRNLNGQDKVFTNRANGLK